MNPIFLLAAIAGFVAAPVTYEFFKLGRFNPQTNHTGRWFASMSGSTLLGFVCVIVVYFTIQDPHQTIITAAACFAGAFAFAMSGCHADPKAALKATQKS